MKVENIKIRITILLTLVAVLVCFSYSSSFSAIAANYDDLQTLTIVYDDQKEPIVNCTFYLYYVAQYTANGTYVPTKEFERYPLELDAETVHRFAYVLEGYVGRDSISPVRTGVTNGQGMVTFENLPSGVYLVLTKRHIQNNVAYVTQPFIVSLAGKPEQVHAYPKAESSPPEATEETACKVLKIWDDNGNENFRPKEITVDLLENGKIYDTVVLNNENNWRYTWVGLNPNSRFIVVEREMGNYIPMIDYQGITYTITNQYREKDTSSTSSKPSSTPSSTPNQEEPPTLPAEKLPQTGQLWWPIPVLFAVGLLFMIFGVLAKRGNKI